MPDRDRTGGATPPSRRTSASRRRTSPTPSTPDLDAACLRHAKRPSAVPERAVCGTVMFISGDEHRRARARARNEASVPTAAGGPCRADRLAPRARPSYQRNAGPCESTSPPSCSPKAGRLVGPCFAYGTIRESDHCRSPTDLDSEVSQRPLVDPQTGRDLAQWPGSRRLSPP
jgi:hypothetical protein